MGNVTEYNGSEKYIFVSYCHKDKSLVQPIISALASQGYRVWFDSGIYPGTEWPEVIAAHLEKCSAFIACVSGNSMQSHNCRSELNYAILKGKPFIGVILERVKLTPGMEMQMSTFQSLYYYNFATFGEFFDRLTESPCLEQCRGEVPQPAVNAPHGIVKSMPKPAPRPAVDPAPKPAQPAVNAPQGAVKSMPRPAVDPAPKQANSLPKTVQVNNLPKTVQVNKSSFCSIIREKTGEVIPINRGEFTIGRKKELCSYAVTDNPAISRVHAILRSDGKTMTLTDNRSLNFTSLNGKTLPKGGSAALKNGDVFSVADEKFRVHIEV